MLISAAGLKKSFSERVLFDNASFSIDNNDKIGFVGSNGVGKSTFFKILIGKESYDSGDLFISKQLKAGYLDQYSCAGSVKTVFDEVLEVYADIIDIENELEDLRLEIESGSGDLDSLIARQTYLNDLFAARDGYFYKNKIKSTLIGLGFCEEQLSQHVDKLSGGQKTRVELAKILLSDSNLLLLDEPTNHLDIESVEWLEEFLRGYKGAFVVISHDRYFLDRVTEKTFEISDCHFYSFNGSYSKYAAEKEIIELTKKREYENKMNEIERLEAVIAQQRRWNREKNIKTAESKQKVVDKIKSTLEKPADEEKAIEFDFKAYEGGGNDVLTVRSLEMAFGERKLFSGVDFDVLKGEKLFLLGPNGCGKTTLLKIILGELSQKGGTVKLGADIHIGYYDQTQENLNDEKTVIDEVWDEFPTLTHTQIRNALAAFLFRGDDVFKEISTLSGGERARVLLVKLILKKVNFLIMDEPTNHLDIHSREALEEALRSYGGTMLMVSHDRYFINRLSDRILYLTDEGIVNYLGSYDDFCEKRKAAAESEDKKEEKKNGGEDYRERKRRESEKRKKISAAKRAEDEIEKIEKENEELSELLLTEKIATDYEKAAEISKKLEENEEKLSQLLEEWERLSLEIEND